MAAVGHEHAAVDPPTLRAAQHGRLRAPLLRRRAAAARRPAGPRETCAPCARTRALWSWSRRPGRARTPRASALRAARCRAAGPGAQGPPQFLVDDRAHVPRLAAARVADGLLALGVGPAGAVGDELRVLLAEQPADDLAQRAELVVGGIGQRRPDVVAEGEVAGGRFGVAGAFGGSPLAVLLGGVAQLPTFGSSTGRSLTPMSRSWCCGGSPARISARWSCSLSPTGGRFWLSCPNRIGSSCGWV
jgi:hypothetical protein